MVFGLKEEDDNLSKVDEDMIMVIADKIISERMEVLENKMSRQFDAKLKIFIKYIKGYAIKWIYKFSFLPSHIYNNTRDGNVP
jgi:hypothetical protein